MAPRIRSVPCIVKDCHSSLTTAKHKIPKAKWIRDKWIAEIGLPLANATEVQINKCQVCADHFLKSDYFQTSKRRDLITNRVPSVNMHPNPAMIESPEVLVTAPIEVGEPPLVMDRLQEAMSAWEEDSESPEDSCAPNSSEPLITSRCYTGAVRETEAGEEISQAEIIVKLTSKLLKEKSHVISLQKKLKQTQQNNGRNCRKLVTIKKEMKISGFNNLKRLNTSHSIFVGMQLTKVGVKRKVPWSLLCLFIIMHLIQFYPCISIVASEEREYQITFDPWGRRYTRDEKITAVTMYKRAPQSYRMLSANFILPQRTAVTKILRAVKCPTGPKEIVFKKLKKISEEMPEKEKYCILMWDEVKLMTQIQFDQVQDKIFGFEDWGFKREGAFADHAIVFLLRGINSGWKLPIFYGFCDSLRRKEKLIECLEILVPKVEATGCHVCATVCDQLSTNLATIKYFIAKRNAAHPDVNDEDIMEIENTPVIPLICTSHGEKGLRNNLITKPLEFNACIQPPEVRPLSERQFAKWSVITTAYIIDTTSNMSTNVMNKLTDDHIYVEKMKKMRVKPAAQVLSKTVADFIIFLAKLKDPVMTPVGMLEIPLKDGLDTATVLLFLNQLFDSVIGHLPADAKAPLRCIVTAESPHHDFWKKSIPILERMHFVDPVSFVNKYVPTLPSWILTIKGFQKLWELLESKGFKQFKPRYISQDPLENYFGSVRAYGCRNVMPSCWQFGWIYKSLLITNMTSVQSTGTNCEAICDGEMLFPIDDLIINHENDGAMSEVEDEELENIFDPEEILLSSRVDCSTNPITEATLSKCASVIHHLLVMNPIVKSCQECSMSFNRLETSKNQSRFDQFYEHVHLRLRELLPKFCNSSHISAMLLQKIHEGMMYQWISCNNANHRENLQSLAMKLIIKNYITTWCIMINRHLTGKASNMKDQLMFNRATKKYEKGLKHPKL